MIVAALAMIALGGSPQDRRAPVDNSKIFTFNAGQLGQWNNHFGIDPDLESARKSRKPQDEDLPTRAAGDQVTVSGNFAFTFTARGPGTTTSALQTNDISMQTNQQLTITTSNFGSLVDSGNVTRPGAGSVEYEFSIRRNNTVLDGPDTGVGAAANGFTLIAPDPPGSSSRTYTLRIRRRITLTEEAKGGETYTATGRINLTIN